MCWGQIIGGAAQAGQSGLQGEQGAATATSNAELLDLKAADALKRGGIAEDIQRNKGAQLMGFQRAAMGASGIQVDSGSGGKVLEQTAAMTELDALNTRTNAMREAWGYSTEAQSQRDAAENAMGMMDFLAPGGRKFQDKFLKGQIKDLTLGSLGIPSNAALKSYKSYDNKRTAWGK